MTILGIDTATGVLSVAILDKEKVITSYFTDSYKNHSGILLPVIKSQFKKAKLKLKDINLIAVSIGPGSFTGLRVGISLAKGFAFSLKTPLIGVPTLDALAKRVVNMDTSRMECVPVTNFICPMLDAKKNQIYTALYRCENKGLKKLTEYLAVEFDELCRLIEKVLKKENIVFTGESISIYKAALKKRFEKVSFVCYPTQFANAINVAELGIERFKKGEIDSIYSLTPLYIRNPDVREH